MGNGTGVGDVLIIGFVGTLVGIGVLLIGGYLLISTMLNNNNNTLATRGRAMYSRRYGF